MQVAAKMRLVPFPDPDFPGQLLLISISGIGAACALESGTFLCMYLIHMSTVQISYFVVRCYGQQLLYIRYVCCSVLQCVAMCCSELFQSGTCDVASGMRRIVQMCDMTPVFST